MRPDTPSRTESLADAEACALANLGRPREATLDRGWPDLLVWSFGGVGLLFVLWIAVQIGHLWALM